MKKLLKDMFTGKDNSTFDIGRLLIFISCFVYFVIALSHAFLGTPFEPISYGAGFGALLAGGAGGLAIKQRTEPDLDKKNDSI